MNKESDINSIIEQFAGLSVSTECTLMQEVVTQVMAREEKIDILI